LSEKFKFYTVIYGYDIPSYRPAGDMITTRGDGDIDEDEDKKYI